MRKSYFLVIVAMMLMVTGCDFFRQLAGRPTSADIQVRRQEVQADIEAKAAQEKARQDSLAAILKNEKDSTEACVYIEANKIRVCLASELKGIAEDGLTDFTCGTRYRVILGSFRSRDNAVKMLGRVADSGDFWPHLIKMRNGMIAVAACPSDRIQNVVWGLKELQTHEVCPSDAWILKIE